MLEIISRDEAEAKGLRRYFTGKPCKHGHVAERFVSYSGCVECGDGRNKKRLRIPRIRSDLTVKRADAEARGLVRFFTGVSCKYGHVCERYTLSSNCVECARSHSFKSGLKRYPSRWKWRPCAICNRPFHGKGKCCSMECSIVRKQEYAGDYQRMRMRDPVRHAARLKKQRKTRQKMTIAKAVMERLGIELHGGLYERRMIAKAIIERLGIEI